LVGIIWMLRRRAQSRAQAAFVSSTWTARRGEEMCSSLILNQSWLDGSRIDCD
jgi:hypothetical protein